MIRISTDENPTPPQSPNPTVHISPPGSHFPSYSDSDFLPFEHSIFSKSIHKADKVSTNEPVDPLCSASPVSVPLALFLPSLGLSYSDIPPTPPAVKVAFPSLPSPPITPVETLAERRASAGKLPNKALLSLLKMKFEASEEAGMGLGVGPGSAGFDGMEGVSPGQSGKIFQLAMGMDTTNQNDASPSNSYRVPKSPLLAAPGLENDGRRSLRRTGSAGNLRPSRSRSPLRSTRPYSFHSTASPTLSSSSPTCPASPLVKRSSAYSSSANGPLTPLTPLTPSHIPGAPALGNGSSAFEWFSYSTPDSPGVPIIPASQAIPQFDRFTTLQTLPLTPTSDSGSVTPTGRTRYTSKPASRIPSSPLGRGRFDEESSTSKSNPFFV